MNKTVLLLDDEPLVLSYLASCLKEAGYASILKARSGHMARVSLVQQPIHILVSDVHLPDIDGRDFAREFLTINPEGQVLLMTGFAPEDVEMPPELKERVQLLEKPFSSERLIQMLERAGEAKAVMVPA